MEVLTRGMDMLRLSAGSATVSGFGIHRAVIIAATVRLDCMLPSPASVMRYDHAPGLLWDHPDGSKATCPSFVVSEAEAHLHRIDADIELLPCPADQILHSLRPSSERVSVCWLSRRHSHSLEAHKVSWAHFVLCDLRHRRCWYHARCSALLDIGITQQKESRSLEDVEPFTVVVMVVDFLRQ